MEIVATVTDKSGKRPKIAVPPSFSLPNFPNIRDIPRNPGIPDAIPTKKPKIETTTQGHTETVPDTTITTQAPKSTEVTTEDSAINEDKKDNKSIITEENKVDNISMTVIPLVAICGLVLIVAAVIFFVWRRNTSPSSKSKKDDNMVSEVKNNINVITSKVFRKLAFILNALIYSVHALRNNNDKIDKHLQVLTKRCK